MPRITKLVSFWSFVAFATLMLLQSFPYTGIFLMILQGALVTAALVHVCLISLFIEAILRRVPRILLIVPIVAYGTYYATYIYQTAAIARTAAAMRLSNPGKIFDFDARSHSLSVADADNFIKAYAVPVAYEPNNNFQPEGHLSYRLIRRDQCGIKQDSQHRIQTYGVHIGKRFIQNVCMLRFPEAPSKKIVQAIQRGDDEIWRRKWGISEQVTDIIVDGAVIGSYRSASVWRLPALPIGMLGCGLIGNGTPKWECGGDFMRTHMVIDTVPAGVDRQSYDSPVSVMLGLKKYTAADLSNFRGYELNDQALARIAGEPGRVEDSAFEALEAIVEGRNFNLPFNLGYSLAQNPDRLAPYAARMARRFVELNKNSPRAPSDQEQRTALEIALVSLPRAAFLDVVDQLFHILQQDASWDRYPGLYVRAGDGGPKTFAHYKHDFMIGKLTLHMRMLPVLAICRIGRADAETVAEMKRRFILNTDGYDSDDYQSALIVTLTQLGEQAFLRENISQVHERLRDWADAVLEGRGATDIGPNNCMTQWGNTRYHGPMMEPGLRWVLDAWQPRVHSN